ncbi:hypothetical protein HN680_08070 [Candidatus Peregrinibacteria bacterium]|jgi:hypothetical protein|nr:hypothetical protein [Candidatus Peregrinibacteria bacterium]
MKLVELRYIGNIKIIIPFLKSRGGQGPKLPLMDYNKNKPLPKSEQIITVSENEAGDLMRSWRGQFEIVRPKRKKQEV